MPERMKAGVLRFAVFVGDGCRYLGGFNARAAELPELEVNQAFVQRFVAYTRTDSTTLTLNNESVFDCTADE